MPAQDFLLDRLTRHTPLIPATWTLIALNGLVFAALLLAGAGLWQTPNGVQLAWGANFGPATKDGEWWRLLAAMFLHFGVLHLAMNLWALWDAGRLVERLYGSLRFVLIYFGSGLAGNLVSLIAQGDKAVSGGASGAIFGLFGALMLALYMQRKSLHAHEFRWLFWGAAGFSALTIGYGLSTTGIDNAAHGGGLLAGILLGRALLLPLNGQAALPRRPALLAGAVFTALIIIIVANIPKPTYRWQDEAKARDEIRQFFVQDMKLNAQMNNVLQQGRQGRSFDELAGTLENKVSRGYEQSFDTLSAINITPQTPSAAKLAELRRYAELRRDATRELAYALRSGDERRIRDALDKAEKAKMKSKANAAAP